MADAPSWWTQAAQGHPADTSEVRAWLCDLPRELPDPAVMVADDGSLHVEWGFTSGLLLYVTFYSDGSQETYFEDQAFSEEWEGSSVLNDPRVTQAILRLTGAAITLDVLADPEQSAALARALLQAQTGRHAPLGEQEGRTPGDEFPGMWEASDFVGGETDGQAS